MSLASQQRLGSYRLLNVIMTGQTSQVWEAMDDSRQRRVAIKLLLSDYRRNREHIGYLKHEWEVGSKLDHPNVIHLFEFATKDGFPFIAMEYFPWPNLKQYINRGVEVLGYFAPKIIELCGEGLAYFNEQGWIHRDVKPDNFLMTDEADIRLIDFALGMKPKTGLARLFAGKTKVQGTRSYMSPEQIRGQPLDQRADVYSFACMAFELLTGKLPYTGTSANDLLMKHIRAAPPNAEAANRNITPETAQILQRAMAKKPDDRPESMSQLLREFGSARIFKTTPPPPGSEDSTQDST